MSNHKGKNRGGDVNKTPKKLTPFKYNKLKSPAAIIKLLESKRNDRIRMDKALLVIEEKKIQMDKRKVKKEEKDLNKRLKTMYSNTIYMKRQSSSSSSSTRGKQKKEKTDEDEEEKKDVSIVCKKISVTINDPLCITVKFIK